MISYKYNIYHSRKTKYLEKMLRECCFVWNHALALQRRYYKLFGKYISIGKMKKYFAKRIKRNLLHSQTTQEILERLDESYNRFFKKLAKRPPKFKSPEKFNSFVFKQGGFTLNGNCLTINKGNKRFRFSYSRGYEGNFDTCYTILISYAEIFPKGSHQIIAYFFHKFFECHKLLF
jgi:putative transposase